jgi:hypothetical protein
VKQKITFSPEELKSFKAMIRALAQFKQLSERFPVSYMETLLQVAVKQGLGTTEYAERVSIGKDSTSRTLGVLGERPRARDEKVYGFLEQCDDPIDSRKTHYFVTSKGAQLLKKIHQELEA